MSITRAGVVGTVPTVLIQPSQAVQDGEQAKYEKMWAIDAYRNYAPGEGAASMFLELASPSPRDTVIDFGAGTGRGALMITLLGGCKVHMLDFAENCLDEDLKNALYTQAHVLKFSKHDLRTPVPFIAEYGFCTDVMEHIPPQDVDAVLHHILKAARNVFFQISTQPDHFGQEIGEHLHLTVQPYEWWLAKMKEQEAVVQWSSDGNGICGFYVTAWVPTRELMQGCKLNNTDEEVRSNTLVNMERGLEELRPHQPNDIPIMLLAGGPSMNDFAEEIVTRRKAGEKLITVNAAYGWALSHGVNPSAQIMVDSREFNKRFLDPVIPECKYLLASQCHPSVFDAVPAAQALLWHSAIDEDMLDFFEQHYLKTNKAWYPILGGSTVILRTIPLLHMLGYSKFEIFGFDSCIMDGEHHAYKQAENDYATALQVLVNGRTFLCHSWMISQAQEFLDMMKQVAEHIELVVRGDGLIAWLIQTASEMDDVQLEVLS